VSLFSSLQVSASGMAAQRTRAELLVENIANAETTRTPEGGPYRRKDAVFLTDVQASPFSAVFQNAMDQGVRVAEVIQDDRPPELPYMPSHPDADANGYVAFPRHESGGGDGGSAQRLAVLRRQHSRHFRCKGYDQPVD